MSLRPSDRMLCATIAALTAIEFLQLSMTAFAAGPIMGELGMSPEDFSLAAAVYASVAILAISMQRWFVERIGGRRFIRWATAISILGSVLCATSDDFTSFLLGRIVMAVGGGALFTSARMIIHHMLAGPHRFAGIRALGTSLALSIAAGPWLAAEAVSADSWSAIYWLVAAMGALAFVLGSLTLSPLPLAEDTPPGAPRLGRQALLVGGSFALLYALQRFYYDFFGDRALILLLLGAAVAGLALFAWLQYRDARPLLRIRTLLHPRYLAGMALFTFGYLMLGANNYVVPVMLQRTLGFAWTTVGHVEALGLLAAVATFIAVAHFLPRYPSPRKFLVVGFGALALFGLLLSRLDSSTDLPWHVLPALLCYSVFLLSVLPVAAMQSFRDMENDEPVFANAQQLKNIFAQAGIALGITLATLGQQWRTAVHYVALDNRIVPGDPLFEATVGHLRAALAPLVGAEQATPIAMARLAQLLAQQAAMLANIDHFEVIAVLGLLGIMVTLLQRVFR
jgi:DHA2 family multidrug resistance protein